MFRLLKWIIIGLPLALFIYLAVVFVDVWSATRRDDVAATDRGAYDAVVVLGAAQYDGRPSPVLRSRLDHALGLWRSGEVGQVVVTGSKQPGDRYTEAFTGYRYLREEGVPEDRIVVVTDGGNTYESLAAARPVLERAGIERVLLVSDPYHSARLLGIAEELQVDAGVSPTSSSAASRSLFRETLAVGLGRLITYRRAVRG